MGWKTADVSLKRSENENFARCNYLEKRSISKALFSVVLLVLGLLSSVLNMLWDITLYHVISDGQEQDIKRQLKMLPYYLVHFAFRSLRLATFFIYWRVYDIPALIHA